MEQNYTATTIENDATGFEELKDQILSKNPEEKQEKVETKKPQVNNRKFVFRRGDESLEVDEDFELEMMADKRPIKLTLKELKDRAAGDIAVKNRMHSLAEEKKRINSTFKEFAQIAKGDPLAALEFISMKAKESDSEFEFNTYIEKLAEQADKIGKMDEKERKAFELEKKLNKAEKDLSHKEREQAVILRKQEMLTTYPEIGDSQLASMVEAVLSNEDLLDGLDDEHDVMAKVEELIQETLTQRDIMSVIDEINPDYLDDNDLIFSLSDQLRQNPDLDEEDVREILRELIQPKEVPVNRKDFKRESERDQDIRTLSSKARQGASVKQLHLQKASPFEVLKQQLLDNKTNLKKTPLYNR